MKEITALPFTYKTLTSLPEGCWVKWLATIREWAYIESSTGDYFRGFVPLESITANRFYDNKSGELILTAVLKDGYLFCGKGTLAQNTTSIRIVPVAMGGDEFTGPIVVVEWKNRNIPDSTFEIHTVNAFDSGRLLRINGQVSYRIPPGLFRPIFPYQDTFK